MPATLFVLFNHRLTAKQENDAKKSLDIDRFVFPPQSIQGLWSQIPPEIPELGIYLSPVRNWLKDTAGSGDIVLIQGDFGACHLTAAFCLENGLRPVYSTTRRQAWEAEQADGSVELRHRFDHVIFRHYGR